ncbi:DUF799 domain-containing protein [Chitinimonas sp. BJB300]|uniref:DUF799 domain-containing protein n=1 Tax=Chitinimonas sp. BJB300 TaxID=1559339 RepID=UPI0026D8E07A|nr:DUF799 domain-containing protein [Chitinimonas sp. BJB300]
MMTFDAIKGVGAALLLAVLATGCATPKAYDYSAFKQSRPKSILVLPPLNRSPDVKATYSMLSQMTHPLAESGYYVVPVALANEAFRENGLNNADEVHGVSAKKLREIFGADAALYVTIQEYGTSFKLISSEVTVAAQGKLVDLKTGQVLWSGSARSSSTENNSSNSGDGLTSILISALINQVANTLSDNAHKYAGITSERLLSAGSNGQILYGPRSPKYGTD